MILGLDFYGVVSKRPLPFRELAQTVLQDGEVYIVTAVHASNEGEVRRAVERSRVPYTELIIVTYENYGEVPKKKYEELANLGVQLYIDDRKDTINYLNKRGITSLHFDLKK